MFGFEATPLPVKQRKKIRKTPKPHGSGDSIEPDDVQVCDFSLYFTWCSGGLLELQLGEKFLPFNVILIITCHRFAFALVHAS